MVLQIDDCHASDMDKVLANAAARLSFGML